MEMKSHQKVAASQAVANTQPSQTARRHGVGARTSQASTASDTICNHHCGAPFQGHARDSACATPATTAMLECAANAAPGSRCSRAIRRLRCFRRRATP